MSATQCLFRDDAYLSTAEGRVVAVNERGGIILDRTVFYATSGGQPGDTGRLERADGSMIEIAATIPCGGGVGAAGAADGGRAAGGEVERAARAAGP